MVRMIFRIVVAANLVIASVIVVVGSSVDDDKFAHNGPFSYGKNSDDRPYKTWSVEVLPAFRMPDTLVIYTFVLFL